MKPAELYEMAEVYDDAAERAELRAVRIRRDARRGRRNGAADVKGAGRFTRDDKGADALSTYAFKVTK